MTRDELLDRVTSAELSGWVALYAVRADEAAHRQHVQDSGDGQVFISGGDEDDHDDEHASEE